METFVSLFLGETTNPETGEVVSKVWARRESGAPVKVINSMAELKAYGNPQQVLSSLKLREGQYGKFASLPRVTVKQELSW